MAHAFKNTSLRTLWFGQLLSAVGVEIYRVALVWWMIDWLGKQTGILTSLQSLSMLFALLFGGTLVDRWAAHQTLIRVDLFRAILVMIPVITHLLGYDSPLLIATIAVSIAGLSGLFEPAVQSLIPSYCKDDKDREAANGLFSTTFRMSRVIAPIIVAALATLLPFIHFFTINALTFLASAVSVMLLPKIPIEIKPKKNPLELFQHGIKLLTRNHTLFQVTMAKAFAGASWYLGYGIGLALTVKKIEPNDVGALGTVMGAYGIGNLASALWVGNRPRPKPIRHIATGFIILGLGFLGASFAQSIWILALCAAFIAMGGPKNDTPFQDMILREFNSSELTQFFRARSFMDTSLNLILFATSAILYTFLEISTVFWMISAIQISLGVWLLRLKPTESTI